MPRTITKTTGPALARRCVAYTGCPPMSALPPKADIGTQSWNVRFVPIADISERLSTTELRHGAACRCGIIDARTRGDDPGRIDRAMATVIVRLDVVEMYRFGHTWHLIKGARVIP